MALTQTSSSLTLTLADNNGKRGFVSVSFPPATAPATVLGYVNTVAGIVADLSDAAIIGASVNFAYYETTPETPQADSEIERRMVFVGRAANGGPVRVSVPSPSFSYELDGTDNVSLTDTGVDAMVDFLVNNASSSTGSDITAISEAYVTHRNRRRRR